MTTRSNAQTGNESCLPPTSGPGDQTDVAENEALVDGSGNDIPGDGGGGGGGGGTDGGGDGDWVWRHNLNRIRELCSLGLSPRMLSGVMMRLLKNHFADPDLILTPNLKQYVYDEADSLESKIRIVKSVHFDPQTAGQYPALVVKRLPLQSSRHSMADRLGTRRGNQMTDDLRGISHHSRFISGGHRIFCVAESDGESEDLAQEVFDVLSFLSPAITERLPFHNFEVTGMGEQGALTETATQIGVSVDVTYVYEYAWTLQALAPRLKTFSLGTPQ